MPQTILVPTPDSGETRITFTSSEVGNGNSNDSGTQPNQDGGRAVRIQAENEDGSLTGPVDRRTDEDIEFISNDGTFDVRDLVSGVSRGNQFASVQLGTQDDDTLDAASEDRSAYINGGQGDDDIVGSTADDFLVGGAGDDVLSGSLGDDGLLGGAGSDLAFLNASVGGSDTIDLGSGEDAVIVNRATAGQVRITFTSTEVGNGSTNDGAALANQDGGLAVRIQNENAAGELAGDVSRADDEGIVFIAPDADATFDVRDLVSGVQRGDGFKGVYLGTGEDDPIFLAERTAQAVYVNAGQGDDTVETGDGDDFLVGGAGDDTLTAGAGDDSFIGGTGDDTIDGGAGDDTATFNVSTDGADTVDLGEGDDRLVVNANEVNVADEVNVANEVNAAAANQIRVTFTSAEVGNGDPNDSGTLANQDGGLAVRVQAEDSAGELTGPVSRTDDEGITFVAGSGVTFDVRDLVSGVQRGDGFASVQLGTEDDDTLDAAFEDRSAYINGGQGDDEITGSTADDFLVGGAGDDVLEGGLGDDGLLGGAGSDLAVLDVSLDGSDTIDLGADIDAVAVTRETAGQIRLTFTSGEVGNGSANDSATLANQDGGLAVRIQNENDAGELAGDVSRADDEGIVFVTADDVTFDVRDLVSGVSRGDQFQVAYLGTAEDDAIPLAETTDAATYVNAGQGDDAVETGDGDDFLVGGAGDDTLAAGVGNDGFIGGTGDDTIFGGAGDDTATFNVTTDGADETDLGEGNDRVVVNATAAGQVRLSFTSTEVGNGNPNDSGTLPNQDGDLAVRLQAEDGADGLTGPVSRTDDEGITFVAGTGVTFDVRDLVSGVQRGDGFRTATLGTAAADVFAGTEEADYVNAGQGDDRISGGVGNDFLVGGAGNDTLDGGAGIDGLLGGAGNDRYIVDDAGDRVIEAAGGGTDTVFSFTSYSLAAGQEIEGLQLLAATTGNFNLTGNEFDNTLVGNNGANTLNGGAGADLLVGRGGNDRYIVDDAGDRVIEAAGGGTDTVFSFTSYRLAAGQAIEGLQLLAATTGDFNLTGNEFDNTLVGNNGANTLDGGAGDDLLVGRGGSDRYIVDDAGDQVIEAAGRGIDTVFSFTSYSLAAGQEIEGLQLLAATTGDFNLTGNEFANSLVGNNGANTLNGGAGADILVGRGGSDRYIVDDAGDQVIEAAGRGIDTVFSFTSYSLAAGQEIEGLQLLAATTGNFNITGNEFANSLVGNNGANVLDGGAGADVLVGRGGNDTFAFSTALGRGNVDTIVDFRSGDTIRLSASIFTALSAGELDADAFKDLGTGAAIDASDRILYNSSTGALSYDADGSGAAAAVQFATLQNRATLSASDFVVA